MPADGRQVDQIGLGDLDLGLFIELLGRDAGEVAGTIEHARRNLGEIETAGGDAGLHRHQRVLLPGMRQHREDADRAAAHEDDAGDELALVVDDVGLELDESHLRSEHVDGLEVHTAHDELLVVDRSEPVGESLGGGDLGDVDAGFGGVGDLNCGCVHFR